MSKAETIIKFSNAILVAGIPCILLFTGLFKKSKMPLGEAFGIATVAYLVAFVVSFIGMQFALK